VLLAVAVAPAAAQAPKGKKTPEPAAPAKKPETSKAANFDPNTLSKLAVLVVGNDTPKPAFHTAGADHQRLLEDVFLEALLAKGHTVVARSDVESVFKEKKFQSSGLTEEAAAAVGKFLNVPAVLVLRITDISAEPVRPSGTVGKATIGARLLSVETGAILWSGTHTVSGPISGRSGTSLVVLATAAPLAETFPEKARSGGRPAIDPKAIPKLAVIMVEPHSHPTGTAPRPLAKRDRPPAQSDRDRLVEDAFIQVLIQKGYVLVSRSDLQSVTREQQFQQSGLTEDNAVAAGKLLNVPAVLVVCVTDYGSEPVSGPGGRSQHFARAALAARLIDVGRGEVLWSHGDMNGTTSNTKGDATDVLGGVAKDVANCLPPTTDAGRLMAQASRMEFLGQTSSAVLCYQALAKDHAATPEGKKAAVRLKALGK
jgi:hypothetical protein